MMDISKKERDAGIFYTPPAIVNLMVERIFHWLEKLKKIDRRSGEKFCKSVSRLSFCDPAVGTGNFLLGLIEYLDRTLDFYDDITTKEKNDFLRSFVISNLFGVDLFPESVDICKQRIIRLLPSIKKTELIGLKYGNSLVDEDVYNFIDSIEAKKLSPFSWSKAFNEKKFDVIIGNPPYYNLKKALLTNVHAKLLFEYLKHSKEWKQNFRASSDIYYYFILRGIELLKNDGILSFILPSYWIYNQYADKLRGVLTQNTILELFDFKNAKLFRTERKKQLNISFCILTLQKYQSDTEVMVHRTKEKNLISDFKQITLKQFHSFTIPQFKFSEKRWIISEHWQLLEKLHENKRLLPLSDYAFIAQGMSPGVKSVFVVSKEDVEKYDLETRALRPFVTNKHVTRWLVKDSDLFIIIPKLVDNLDSVPNIKSYLNSHKEELLKGPDRQRLLSKGKIRWYDFSVYRNLEIFITSTPKILCPYRSRHVRFGYDAKGYACATDAYAILPKNPEEIFYLLGILNSSIVEFWAQEMGKKKGEMIEFFSLVLREIPIPIRPKDETISEKTKKLLRNIRNTKNRTYIKKLEKEINEEANQLFKIDIEIQD